MKNITKVSRTALVVLGAAITLVLIGCPDQSEPQDTTPPAGAVSISDLVEEDGGLAFRVENTNTETVEVQITLTPTPPDTAQISVDGGELMPFTNNIRIILPAVSASDGASLENDDSGVLANIAAGSTTSRIRITGLENRVSYQMTATTFDTNGNAQPETTEVTAIPNPLIGTWGRTDTNSFSGTSTRTLVLTSSQYTITTEGTSSILSLSCEYTATSDTITLNVATCEDNVNPFVDSLPYSINGSTLTVNEEDFTKVDFTQPPNTPANLTRYRRER